MISTNFIDIDDLALYINKDTDRYKHIIGVVNLAKKFDDIFNMNNKLFLSTIYHDIGYSEFVAETLFHPVDGAMKAKHDRLDEDVINAILCHTGAKGEALLRNLGLMEYYINADPDDILVKLLTYCDLHTSATGEYCTIEERISGILNRYDENHIVHKNILAHRDYFFNIDKEISLILQK